jgi:hypothetical protein
MNQIFEGVEVQVQRAAFGHNGRSNECTTQKKTPEVME